MSDAFTFGSDASDHCIWKAEGHVTWPSEKVNPGCMAIHLYFEKHL